MVRMVFCLFIVLCTLPAVSQTPAGDNYGLSQVAISKDSVNLIKEMKSFEYMHSIDSLLKDSKLKNSKFSPNTRRNYSFLENILNSGIFKIIIYLVVGILLAWIAFKFWGTRAVFKKRSQEQSKNAENENFENLISADFNVRIATAVSNKNYRVAIKYYYLQTLLLLHEKELVRRSAGKTNNEYLYELPDNLRPAFSILIKQYNYVWYGKMNMEEDSFLNFQNNFINFQNYL